MCIRDSHCPDQKVSNVCTFGCSDLRTNLSIQITAQACGSAAQRVWLDLRAQRVRSKPLLGGTSQESRRNRECLRRVNDDLAQGTELRINLVDAAVTGTRADREDGRAAVALARGVHVGLQRAKRS